MQKTLTEISRFFKSHEFKRALMMTSLILIAGFALFFTGNQEQILGVAIGILLTSFGDIQGSFRHRNLAMILSIITNSIILLIMNTVTGHFGWLLLSIGVISFVLANLSVYGSRATSFALSGLLAMVFSLIRQYSFEELTLYLITFIIGGLLYILVSIIYHKITSKSQTVERLGELVGHTSDYLFARLALAKQNDTSNTDVEILQLQTTITQKQEEVRNLILTNRKSSGQSKTRNRLMLIFIELVDIMELAVANPSTLQVVKENVNNQDKYFPVFFKITEEIAKRLQHFAHVILDNEKLEQVDVFTDLLNEADKTIEKYVEEIGLPKARPGAVMLRNLHDYLEKQVENLDSIERLITNIERQKQIDFSSKQHGKFLTTEDYELDILKDNFNNKAPIFRHSERLTLALIIGYSIGTFLKVENAYWILLTIVVIMQPTYGLTREKSNQRVLGTIIGVILAAGLIQISSNPYFYIAMAAFSMLFAFSLIQRNYLIAATAITLNVVFVFSLIDSNHWQVISFRLIDTVIGAVVSVVVSYIVYPNWEYVNFNTALRNVLRSNQEYLKGIAMYYQNPDEELDYRLLRKQAFLKTSDLNSSFQRFTKDPSSKQKNYSAYFEIVSLNQSMLSTLANLGSYIRNHHIAEINSEFQTISNSISNQLDKLILIIDGDEEIEVNQSQSQLEAEKTIAQRYNMLDKIRNQQLDEGKIQIDKMLRLELQEVRLIKEELDWLQSVTENLNQSISQII